MNNKWNKSGFFVVLEKNFNQKKSKKKKEIGVTKVNKIEKESVVSWMSFKIL